MQAVIERFAAQIEPVGPCYRQLPASCCHVGIIAFWRVCAKNLRQSLAYGVHVLGFTPVVIGRKHQAVIEHVKVETDVGSRSPFPCQSGRTHCRCTGIGVDGSVYHPVLSLKFEYFEIGIRVDITVSKRTVRCTQL